MANSANPEINKKIATSALGTLVIATVFFYLGDRYAETLVTYPGQIFDHLSDAFLSMWQTIKDAPFALDMTSNSLLFGGACFLIIWMIWLRYVAFIGNYRSGEESGSARWGTLKEGKKFKDLQTEDIAERYGGSTYHFGVGTGTHLNPFDTVSVEHMTRNEQIAFKVDAMLAQAGASAAEAGSNFSEVDQSLVQRCTELAFQKAAERGDNLPPTLQDFYDAANEQPEEQAQVIALRYERFVKGSMNFFNHQSNVDFNTRIVDFNLKDLPDSMLVFALINVCEAVRNRMYFNAKRNVRTWLYVEEMQSMFAYPTVLNYFSRFSNEGRKFGLLLTGISQNATAMLANEAARNIVLNADFLMLLKQSPLDRMKWAELLNLSEQEEECIDESAEPGDGLLIAGNARVPIRGKFPSGNVLYDLFSTNPNETKKTGLGDKKDAKPVI